MNTDNFLEVGNIKFRSFYRDSMYKVIEKKSETGIFEGPSLIFYVAFAIGYHFNKQEKIKPKAINHVNLISLDREIKEIMIKLILKRNPKITNSKELWKEVEIYAEYGIQVLYDSLQERDFELNLDKLI